MIEVSARRGRLLGAVEWFARALILSSTFVMGYVVGDMQQEDQELDGALSDHLAPVAARLFANQSDLQLAASAWSPMVTFLDERYTLPTREVVERLLANDATDAAPYASEAWDCDDFAIELLASVRRASRSLPASLAFGMALGERDGIGPHAVNAFFDQHLALWCVEPQDDRVWGCEGFSPHHLLL